HRAGARRRFRRHRSEQLPAGARSDRPRRAARRGQGGQQHHHATEEADVAADRQGDGARCWLRQQAWLLAGEKRMSGRFTARRSTAPEPAAVADAPPLAPAPMSWMATVPELAQDKLPAEPSDPVRTDKLLDAKVRLHRRLIEEINLSALEKLPEDEMRAHIQQLVTQYIVVERLALNTQELNEFVSEILDEMTGLGPLEPLLKDPTINDILINGHESTFVERHGLLEPVACRFKDEAHLLRIINKIVSAVGRRVDESHPLCDARLLDGSRVNVAVRPIGVDGPLVSIRKFSKKPF